MSKEWKRAHRQALKEEGVVHLPPNKKHKSKKDYKRSRKYEEEEEN